MTTTNNGNQFDVTAFDNYLDSLSFKKELDLSKFERIVKGIARKYASIYVEREDLEQELWLLVTEMARNSNGAENLDEKWVARCCYNKAVDKYRYDRRRRDSKAELLDGYTGESDEGKDVEYHHSSGIENAQEILFFKEVVSLFEKNTLCRQYVVTKMYSAGLITKENCDANLTEDELRLPESGDREEDILKELLGYKSKYPASWGKHKGWMKSIIKAYLAGN